MGKIKMNIGIGQILLILIVILFLFGKFPNIMKDLTSGIKNVKSSLELENKEEKK